MSRRPSLPGAAELFRSTGGSGSGSGEAPESPPPARPAPSTERLARLGAPREEPDEPEPERSASVTPLSGAGYPDSGLTGLRAPAAFDDELSDPALRRAPARIRQTRRQSLRGAADRRPSGREKHDEKITVYCSAEELFELERARLALRGDHGLVVDRGRIVREAVAVVLADLEAKGESSILVRRLRES